MSPLLRLLSMVLLAGVVSAAYPERAIGGAADPAAPRPNFLILIGDDHGDGDLSSYGHPYLRTPGIDRLAREGMRFTAAFLTTSSCSPSRSSILTGRYPHQTGAEDLHQPLPADQKTLASYLRPGGYHCAAVGKWHLGPAEKKNWNRALDCPGKEIAERTIELLRARPPSEPFFFWVASTDPHRPFEGDAGAEPHDPARVSVPPYLPDHPLVRKDLAAYYGEVTRWDRQVGLILDELEHQGEIDRTFIVYLSDNGMPFPRAKTTLYDSGIRTPFLVRYPPVARAGSVQAGLASAVDLAPTILELAGVAQDSLPGRSLLPLLRDPSAPGRDAVYAEANWHHFEQFTRAVRTQRFLLVRNYYWDKPLWSSVDSLHSTSWDGLLAERAAGRLTPAQRFLFIEPRPFEELYDLQVDPSSFENVIDDPRYREARDRLRVLLDNWRVETNDRMPAERRPDGWTRDGIPFPHNQPWYDLWKKEGLKVFGKP